MRQIVATSAGELTIALHRYPAVGVGATVVVFDEDGWKRAERSWWEIYPAESLAQAITTVAQLPPDEAEAIAERALAGWVERGGRVAVEPGSWEPFGIFGATALFGLLGVAALVAGAVWLLLTLF